MAKTAADTDPQRLFVYNGGFLTQRRLRRILELSGYDIKLGKPGPEDLIGIWGQSPTSPRGEAVASRTNSPILRVEDAFLRSVHTGRDGDLPIGLHLDQSGVHFDPSTPSDLEKILSTHPLDDTALLNRARDGMARIKQLHLSKYNAFDPTTPPPDPGYVLIIDQTRGDASLKSSRANRDTFYEMLYYAQTDHPGARIVIKTHPETENGHRDGHFRSSDANDRVTLLSDPLSPYALFEGAIAVYTVSSQMGFEAIIAGHKPVVFGQPFYAGWGLSDDRMPLDRRQRNLTRAQLFAAAMILYPTWYDPCQDCLCPFETAVEQLAAQVRSWREDRHGWHALGMRLWKRQPLQKFFGRYEKLRFHDALPSEFDGQSNRVMVWSGKDTETLKSAGSIRVEDGFLRSRGLGADLIPPLSLVCDDLGIYYDPTCESRLEHLINHAPPLTGIQRQRIENIIRQITRMGVSKYNLTEGALPDHIPAGRTILVPGQVEDDASITQGTTDVSTNLGLLERARIENPDAVILYKPHPDVEAGLRQGHIENAEQFADAILTNTSIAQVLDRVDAVWTMTSLTGFEALLRGKSVTCLGQPFYAGWGLTRDLGGAPQRRTARPDLETLAYRTLIDYPRYFDPVSNLPCTVETVLNRLIKNDIPSPGPMNRVIAKLQGALASYAYLWR